MSEKITIADLFGVMVEIRDLLREMVPKPANKRSRRDDLEARAIVLAATMPKPSYGKIAKLLDVPKSTLSYWPNLKVAFDERYKRTGEAKRGFRNADGSVEGIADE